MSETLLSGYDALLSDLDGVVYAGPFAIPGAPEALNRAEDSGTPVVFVTNNASRSVDSVAEHLRELGVKTRADRVVSSAQASAALLAQQLPAGANVLVTGTDALANCVREAGLTPCTVTARKPGSGCSRIQPTPHLGRSGRGILHSCRRTGAMGGD